MSIKICRFKIVDPSKDPGKKGNHENRIKILMFFIIFHERFFILLCRVISNGFRPKSVRWPERDLCVFCMLITTLRWLLFLFVLQQGKPFIETYSGVRSFTIALTKARWCEFCEKDRSVTRQTSKVQHHIVLFLRAKISCVSIRHCSGSSLSFWSLSACFSTTHWLLIVSILRPILFRFLYSFYLVSTVLCQSPSWRSIRRRRTFDFWLCRHAGNIQIFLSIFSYFVWKRDKIDFVCWWVGWTRQPKNVEIHWHHRRLQPR